MKALVNKIIPFSSVDGPGNRTAIFLQGCNFNCLYCHNPETINQCVNCGQCVKVCPVGALSMQDGKVCYDYTKCVFCDACFKQCPNSSSPRVRSMTPEEVMVEVRKNVPFIRGITVSGGECTRWRDFLVELLDIARAEGLSTLLDSNGSYDFSQDPELLAVTDGVMLDIKAWTSEDHKAVTGVDNTQVRANLEFLARAGKLEELRTVVVPGLFDAETAVREASAVAAPWQDKHPMRYKIICYRPMGVRESEKERLQQPTAEYLQQLADLARAQGIRDVVIT